MIDRSQLLNHIAACEAKSKANPRKVIRVCRGSYFLTVEGQTWDINFDRDINRWCAYVDRFVYADEKLTKREMIESLLA